MTKVIRLYAICMLFCFSIIKLSAQVQSSNSDVEIKVEIKKVNNNLPGIQAYSSYIIDHNTFKEVLGHKDRNLSISMLISGVEKVLVLEQVNILGGGFKVKLASNSPSTSSKTKFYRGHLSDDLLSMISLTVSEDELKILISTKQFEYKVHKSIDGYIGYFDKDINSQAPGLCLTDDTPSYIGQADNKVLKANNTAKSIEIYLECDYQSFLDNGSADATQFWALSLFNEVSALYAADGIDLILSQVKIWDRIDPYRNEIGITGMLTKFGEGVKDNYKGRLAHLLTTRFTGGIAWVDVLCRKFRPGYSYGPYSLSAGLSTGITRIPNYSWNVHVVAHEIGHNIGSPHTHSCVWGKDKNQAIDNCGVDSNCSVGPAPVNGGTIMSYCHNTQYGINFANGFGEEPLALLKDRISKADCLIQLENDECVAAIDLIVTQDPTYTSYTNNKATSSQGHPSFSCGDTGATLDVWFKVKIPSSGHIVIESIMVSNGLSDMIMMVYEGSCNSLKGISCRMTM